MLSLEAEIIDATTDEGKKQVKALEEEAKRKKESIAEEDDVEEVVRQPPQRSLAEEVD